MLSADEPDTIISARLGPPVVIGIGNQEFFVASDVPAILEHTRDVFFLGRCEQVADLLSVSDVCVLSSRAEGFSNAILEYMAAARPVVVTDVGGACEVVTDGETGYIVPAGNDAEMAERIIQLLRHPRRAQAMGERGRQIVVEKFSCAVQLERTLALYDSLLAQSAKNFAHPAPDLRQERA